MIFLLNIITHIMIILGIIGLIFYISYAVHKEQEMFEKVILIISSMTGFLIYFGARALGLSIPSMMMSFVSMANPVKMTFFAIIIPWSVGTIVAWYFSWCLKKHIDIAFRIVILISAFIVTLFSDVYAASYTVSINGEIDTSLLPNLTFTVGMGLYIILNYKHR
ncbi:hypothetical protein [Candidatus Electronema sp. JC]|uniref:hypothetical protein n=1 Tax=Candidatus Electronema sp. JC TaxID=3401570 RepID=UPI003B42DF1F